MISETGQRAAEFPPPADLDSTVGGLAYLCLCLHAFFFSALLAADPSTLRPLSMEDHWVEYLTAVWFLLAGLLLFITASAERNFFRRCVYILGGMAMMFAAGEEISWGQRILGFATPDFLMHVNRQKEFNVHNVAGRVFSSAYRNGTLILCMVTSAAFFCRRDRLFGIPLPSVLLMLGFLMLLSFQRLAGIGGFFDFIVSNEKGLLLLFLIFTLVSGQVKLSIAPAATLALVLALSYVNYYSVNYGSTSGKSEEIREYLFGIGCVFYSLELALAQGRLTAISRVFTGLKTPIGGFPLWLITCSSMIAGSVGLTFFQYFNAVAKTTAIENVYRSTTAGELVVRSNFNVYLIEDELIYAKESCTPTDTEPRFFLHVHPVDTNDLPGVHKQFGFDNLDFNIGRYNYMRFGGKCLVIKPLPGYKITSVRTGQYIPGKATIWKAEFPVGMVERGQDH